MRNINQDIHNQNFNFNHNGDRNSLNIINIFLILSFIAIIYLIYCIPSVRTLNWIKSEATITKIIDRIEFQPKSNKEEDTVRYIFDYIYEVDGNKYTGQGSKYILLSSEKYILHNIKFNEDFLKKYPQSKNRITIENDIQKNKKSLIAENSKVDILVNPKSYNESVLYKEITKISIYLLIIIILICYFYTVKLLLQIYAKFKVEPSSFITNDAFIKNHLPLELANKTYWMPLSLGCFLLKPYLDKHKEKNILQINISSIIILAILGYFAYIFLAVTVCYYADFDPKIFIIFLIYPPYIESITQPNAFFNKETYECYSYEGKHKVTVTKLDNILALQILPILKYNRKIGGYQLNMIFDPDKNKSNNSENKIYKRHYILSYKDFNIVEDIANRISEFINVPIIYAPNINDNLKNLKN